MPPLCQQPPCEPLLLQKTQQGNGQPSLSPAALRYFRTNSSGSRRPAAESERHCQGPGKAKGWVS